MTSLFNFKLETHISFFVKKVKNEDEKKMNIGQFIYTLKSQFLQIQKMHANEKLITLYFSLSLWNRNPVLIMYCIYHGQYRKFEICFFLCSILFWVIYTSAQTLISLCLLYHSGMISSKAFYLTVSTEAAVGWEFGPWHDGCVQLLQDKVLTAAWHSPIDWTCH